ncbi:ATP-dependent DNA helicase RecG [Dictyobacter sp. S3.2.2.5]|uniref:ATP-dependent DNA helicase RecQ n=1 Tax=Dictyobacter halimunensis TaxID=3026934 RepID=A0ABQ6G4S5_9CHLR|nr:ATP-dependent DNA helicase RecG [Dictyobacter sp. S3.2.2.5]
MTIELIQENNSLETTLVERFHINTGFHDGQRDIIERLIQGKRVLAIQRTGWGKSLCYQMASLYYSGLTIVFSPLKALMRDQCLRCTKNYGIPAEIVSSDFSEEQNTAVLLKAINKHIKILFISPERLDNLNWQKHVTEMSISMVVIDEAHCISTWGHDFRPSYRRISNLLRFLPENTPVLALTATANKRVEEDILFQVGDNTEVIRGTMKRPNLSLEVVSLNGNQTKLDYLGAILPQLPGTGIVYTATRKDAALVASFLRHKGIDSRYYHAGLDNNVRQEIELELYQNQRKVFCSTSALGMGIDKSDLRFVIHYHFPSSPIYYYQEIGRAGRDGESSHCILLYDQKDIEIQEHLIHIAKSKEQHYDMVLTAIRQSLVQGLRERDILLKVPIPSQNALRKILSDLQDQELVEQKNGYYKATPQLKQVNFSYDDAALQHKSQELQEMINYANINTCYMNFLSKYLGDLENDPCGNCSHCTGVTLPFVAPLAGMQQDIFEEKFLPPIEKRSNQIAQHEAGYSLAYYQNSKIGSLVHRSKYKNGGPFPDELVQRAVEVIREQYPLHLIDIITSIPPTKSGDLVETFAKSIADMLSITYVRALRKARETREQKEFVNKVQKERNIKNAFVVSTPQLVIGRTLLLVDDIYDSGYTIQTAAQELRKTGALAVYPFTITRTSHSDDQ